MRGLFLFLVDGVRLGNWIEFLEFKLLVRVLLFVLAGVVGMPLTNAFRVALGDQLNEFIL